MSRPEDDELILSLKIIAQLRAGGRLSTRGETIEVDGHSGIWQAALRWLNSESRQTNIDHVTTILGGAIEQLTTRESDADFCNRLRAELQRTIEGIRNLRLTYRGCSRSTARIDVLIENIQRATGDFTPRSEASTTD